MIFKHCEIVTLYRNVLLFDHATFLLFRNACPVREEVFAPYWANNTRDNTLAILNLYPFEQYIHMETCRFENEEMLCRKGCKCEQQYRLHRLLAFDPTKECRGIFSDWFRFPSYCVCKFQQFEFFTPKILFLLIHFFFAKKHIFHVFTNLNYIVPKIIFFSNFQIFEFSSQKYYFSNFQIFEFSRTKSYFSCIY